MFTDAYDVLIYENANDIIEKFKAFNANVVFGAETYCNPDRQKAYRFPKVNGMQKSFLNSGGYIGKLKNIYAIINHIIEKYKATNNESDQNNFQEVYLNVRLREKHRIKLDHNSTIFFNLYGAADDTEFHCIKGNLR